MPVSLQCNGLKEETQKHEVIPDPRMEGEGRKQTPNLRGKRGKHANHRSP